MSNDQHWEKTDRGYFIRLPERDLAGQAIQTGWQLMETGNYEAALSELLRGRSLWLEAHPDFGSTPAIEVTIGECYEKLGKRSEAITAYHSCLETIDSWPALTRSAMDEVKGRATAGLQRLNA